MIIFLTVLVAIVIFFMGVGAGRWSMTKLADDAKSLEERENKLREAQILFEIDRLLLAEQQVELVASKQSKDKEGLAPVEKIKRRPRKSKK